MMKKILLVSLIATTGLIGVHKIQPPQKENGAHLVVKNMMVEKGSKDSEIGEDVTFDTQLLNQATVEVLDDTDYEFAGMFVNGFYKADGCVGSTNKVALHGSNTEVCNYYTNTEENMVFIIDTNNRLISHMAVTNGDFVAAEDITAATSVMAAPAGYTIANELYYGDNQAFVPGTTTVTEDMILRSKLTYDESYATYQVAVFGDTATVSTDGGTAKTEVDVNFDKMVTVTSTAEDFKCWQIGDRVVSYSKEYKFSVYTDVVVKEVLLTEGEVVDAADKAVINLYHDEVGDDMDTLFVCGYELPDGYRMVETGVLFGGESYETAEHRVMANSISSNNEFAVKYGDNADQTDKDLHVAYLVYEDTAGDIHTVYDNGYGYEQIYFNGVNNTDSKELTLEDVSNVVSFSSCKPSFNFVKKIYGYDDGIKLGSAKVSGEFDITLPEGREADKILVHAKQYKSTEKSISVNDQLWDDLTTTYTLKEFDIISSNKITIKTPSKRAYIDYIEFWYTDRNETEGSKIADAELDKLVVGDNNSVYEAETLPTTTGNYDVSWTKGEDVLTKIIDTDIPDDKNGEMNLTASITINDVEYTKDITVTLVSRANTLANIKAWILTQPGFVNINQVTENLVLPTKYADTGMALSWISYNDEVVNGKTGVVTRTEGNQEFKLDFYVSIAGEDKKDTISGTVLGTAVIVEDIIKKSVGFESDEGFSSSTYYNNTSERSFGATGAKWTTMEGTVSTTDAISGKQSLQCRDYNNSVSPYMKTEFTITEATKIEFLANSTGGLTIIVEYSIDEGKTWINPIEFDNLDGKTTLTYVLPETTNECKFKFTAGNLASNPNKERLYLDDVNFFGYED